MFNHAAYIQHDWLHGLSACASLMQFFLEAAEILALCRLTDSGVGRFIKACPTLQELSLYWNLNVGLQTLGALSTTCTGLTALNLSGCKSVTDAGIAQLAAACTTLRQLDLTRCHGPLHPSQRLCACTSPQSPDVVST